MARIWRGSGVVYGHHIPSGAYDTALVTADLNYLWSIGVRRIRMAMPNYDDTGTIANIQAIAIQAMAKGFYVLAGVTSGKGHLLLTATIWSTFKTYVSGTFATWAQSNSLSELQISNEEEGHADGSTLTAATVRSDVRALAGTIKGGGYTGKVSYSSETSNNNIANWTSDGKGNLDFIHFNTYDVVANFKTRVMAIGNAFGPKSSITEYGSNGGGYSDFNNESTFYTDTLLRIKAMKDGGIQYGYFFTYRDGQFGIAADSYALQLSTGASRVAINAIKNQVNPTRLTAGTRLVNTLSPTNALNFQSNSAQTRMTIANTAVLNSLSAMTYECWVKANGIPAASTRIVDKNQVANNGFLIAMTTAGLLQTQVGNTTTAQGHIAGKIPLGQWAHIAVVWDGANVYSFLNGTQVAAALALSGGTTGTDVLPLVMGNRNPNDKAWNGLIQEIRYSNNARYTANFTPQTTQFVNDANTIVLIHADEGSGTPVDSSSNALTVTLAGATIPNWAVNGGRITKNAAVRKVAGTRLVA